MLSSFIARLLLRSTEFPQGRRGEGLVSHRHAEVLLEHRVVEPDDADIARVSPKNKLASLAGFRIRRPDPVTQSLRVVVDVQLNAIVLDGPAVRRHKVKLHS